MLERILKDVLNDTLSFLIEDFNEDNIQIDKWNGIVAMQNAVFKKTALEGAFSALGAPVVV